ncbi:hypothetical protein GCM10008938_06920 [Deinococcus roseus]|uniref:RDD domain-containing protein n=1 Tax=Deinococcus roseus TaxID=392414 RepID=A0ABQ2CUZ1_9DEIO|nr:hypothetical protein GCM10008938_06920 [Deinococcus roseus]
MAFLFDALLVAGLMWVSQWVLDLWNFPEPFHPLVGLLLVGPFGFGWLYFALLESSRSGQTLGKKLLGIQVKHLTGFPLTFTQASLRWKLRFYLVLFTFSWVFVPPLWMNARRQFLHDSAAESLVLEKSKSEK